ncbi:MAG: hypothetical protein FH749_00025 [Firmicutes bacterium]|nr:hypothetical protein [Bacillota bacterium]
MFICIITEKNGGSCDKTVKRFVEAYIGEYASGKSENAINRSLELLAQSRKVTLVDLDTVEPFYTLRPLKKELETKGLNVIAWAPEEVMGLGEAGSLVNQEMLWALRNPGDIILDIGYGVHGAKIFNLLEGADTDPDFTVIAVVNITRPVTGSVDDIVDYIRELGHVDGLVNNTHLGDETTLEIIEEGAEMIGQAADILELPILYTAVTEELAAKFSETDKQGNPVKVIKRFMPQAFW